MLTESKDSPQHPQLMRRQKQLCESPAQSNDSGVCCRDGPKPIKDPQCPAPGLSPREHAGRQSHMEEPTMELHRTVRAEANTPNSSLFGRDRSLSGKEALDTPF